MPLFSIPLSGLTASSNALSVIANNLANLNTVGFKGEQANFKDLFYQTLGTTGAGNPEQLGAGAAIGSITSNFNDGNVNNTGVLTNVAITGNGFFVTSRNGALQFTRAGNFDVSPAGELITADGQNVMGYPAVNGVINAAAGLVPLQLGQGQISPPAATTTVRQQTNLDARAAVGSTPYTTTMDVRDSLGAVHVLTFQFTKTAAGWNYQVSLPAADTGGTLANPIAQGAMTFDGSGNLLTPPGPIAINITGLTDGANPLNINWNLFDGTGKSLITQVASESTTSGTYQNGYGSGSLLTYSIGADGIIQGAFSNGQTQAIGQIALASFANNQGLLRVGGNSFSQTLSSGSPVIGAPNTGGRGKLSGGALELSNVDISTEFTQLIVTQRGFQANARVVTTFDQITQETINLKSGG